MLEETLPHPGELLLGKVTLYRLYRKLGGLQSRDAREKRNVAPKSVQFARSVWLYQLCYPDNHIYKKRYKCKELEEAALNNIRKIFLVTITKAVRRIYQQPGEWKVEFTKFTSLACKFFKILRFELLWNVYIKGWSCHSFSNNA